MRFSLKWRNEVPVYACFRKVTRPTYTLQTTSEASCITPRCFLIRNTLLVIAHTEISKVSKHRAESDRADDEPSLPLKGTRGGGVAQLVRASDRHAADAGSIPRCGKGFFSQCRLSYVCPYTRVCNGMHFHLCARKRSRRYGVVPEGLLTFLGFLGNAELDTKNREQHYDSLYH